jgi:hypothetical protein
MADTRYHHSFDGVRIAVKHVNPFFKELDIWIKEPLMDYYNHCLFEFHSWYTLRKMQLKNSHCDKLAIPLSYKAQTTNEELSPLSAKTRIGLVNQKRILSDVVLSMSSNVPFLKSLHLDNCRFAGSEKIFIHMPYTSLDSISLTNCDQQKVTWEEDSGGNIVRCFFKANQLITIILQGELNNSS